MVKEGDFIKIEYTGHDDKGAIFDSTYGEIAKSLHGKEGAMLIIFGKDRLIAGLEEALKEMKKGDKRELSFSPEKAFGYRNRDLIRTMPEKDFYKSEIMPEPGLVVTLDMEDGRLNGMVKSVSGGRVLVDFNHALADKNVKYSLTLADIIEGPNEKVKALMDDLSLEGTAVVVGPKLELTLSKKTKDLKEKKDYFVALVKELIPDIKDVSVTESD
jgi:FKBP-type peptidyl-prolyl cis-trans isomerase SlyD